MTAAEKDPLAGPTLHRSDPLAGPTLHTAPLVVLDAAHALPDAGVLVGTDGRVLAVGPRDWLACRADAVVEWQHALLPGLVNAHAHTEYGPAFADLATSGLPFPRWILHLSGRRKEMDEADFYAEAAGSAAQMLATGTTCVADVVTIGPGTSALAEAGLAGTSYLEVVALDATSWPARRATLLEQLAAVPEGRSVGISPHTLYTLGTSVFAEVVALARERGLRLHVHLAETAEESEFVLAGTGAYAKMARRVGWDLELLDGGSGLTPTLHLADLDGVGPDCHVAHGIHVDARDRALLRDSGTVVALCPRSNAVLQSGRPPVADYLREGVPFAVGTDSLASCPSLDLLADARELRRIAIDQGYAEADLPVRLLDAATRVGALACGAEGSGVLAQGSRADMAVLDLGADPARLAADPVARATAVLDAGVCVATVLAGQVVRRS